MGVPYVMFNATAGKNIVGMTEIDIFDADGIPGRGTTIIEEDGPDVGDTIRITGSGKLTCTLAAAQTVDIGICLPSGTSIGKTRLTVPANAGTRTLYFEFLITFRAVDADGVVSVNGIAFLGNNSPSTSTTLPNSGDVNTENNNALGLTIQLSAADARFAMLLDQCVIEYLFALDGGPWRLILGTVWEIFDGFFDGKSSGTTTPSGQTTGKLSASTIYASTYYAATAVQDTGKTGNSVSVTFTYQGSEGGGGVAVGLRWNETSQQGIFAFIDSSGGNIVIYEMTSGWTYVQQDSTSLTLTTGKRYTLTITDNGTSANAVIIDDNGVQTSAITTSSHTANTQVMFGWIGTSASHAFDAVITKVAVMQSGTVETPRFSVSPGTYTTAQDVLISTPTLGAAIYYTTNGSTPTTSSTLYTGPITVSATETIKAISALPGWTNSSVASGAYTITGTVATPTFSPAAGTYSSTQSVTISTATSGADIYYTTDGSTPVYGGNLYTGAISVSTSQTVKAIGTKASWADSAVGSAAYVITSGTWTMEYGTINSHTSGTFTLTGSNTGTTGSGFPISALAVASAYQDISSTGNTVSVTFTYNSGEAASSFGGVACGLRWKDSSQQGIYAAILSDGLGGSLISLVELTTSWSTVQSNTSSSLVLTSGNSYTLTISDTGTSVTASLVDNSSTKSASLTTTLHAGNTEVMFGWMSSGSLYSFTSTVITGVSF